MHKSIGCIYCRTINRESPPEQSVCLGPLRGETAEEVHQRKFCEEENKLREQMGQDAVSLPAGELKGACQSFGKCASVLCHQAVEFAQSMHQDPSL